MTNFILILATAVHFHCSFIPNLANSKRRGHRKTFARKIFGPPSYLLHRFLLLPLRAIGPLTTPEELLSVYITILDERGKALDLHTGCTISNWRFLCLTLESLNSVSIHALCNFQLLTRTQITLFSSFQPFLHCHISPIHQLSCSTAGFD